MTDSNEQGALIGAIYEAGLDASNWAGTLSSICQAIGAEAANLFSRDGTLAAPRVAYTAYIGYPPDASGRYFSYYSSRDIRLPYTARVPVGKVYVDDQQTPFTEVMRSEIFHDFYRPMGLGFGMGAILFRNGSRFGVLSTHRRLQGGGFPSESIAIFEQLTPHLVRALQIHRQVQRAEQLATGLALTLDHFPLAVLLVDPTGRVRHMNVRASELLRLSSCPLRVVADHIATHDLNCTAQLVEQIRRATALAQGQLEHPVDLVHLRGRDGATSLSVMVAPLREGRQIGLPSEPLVAVFISDPSQVVPPDLPILMQQFGLTKAEASIAVALASEANLQDIAEARHISIETVRRQLKQAMAKTDSHSQGQLIGRLGRSLALLRQNRNR